ncbi:MAG: hypothetical protein WDO13_02865 [Verrucomicrobiota bacterium]
MEEYLKYAENALAQAKKPADFKKRMLERFPGYAAAKVVDHQLRFLFPPKGR